MSFIFLLIFSMSTLTQVELATASHTKAETTAKENARLGLLVALGQLQQAAGADQRVTARAEILGDGNYDASNQYWTGVWDTTDMSEDPVWLVSGSPVVTTAPSDTAQLVKSTYSPITGQIIPAVNAPAVEVFENQTHVGNYAYWISGENEKLSLSAMERVADFPTQETERRYLEYQSIVPDLNYLDSAGYTTTTTDNFDINANSDLGDMLANAISNDQFALIDLTNSNDAAFPTWRSSGFSHDATANTWSVLANTKDGGLKRNLFDDTLTDAIANSATRDFLVGYEDTLDASTDSTSGIADGEPYFEPRAIPTELTLWIGIFHTWTDAKLRIRFHLQCEFWNPYTIPLIYASDTDSRYDRAFTVRFENLPTVTIEQISGNMKAPTIIEDLNDFSAYADGNYRETINSWVEIPTISSLNKPELGPGEVYGVTEPNPNTQAYGLARDFGTIRWSGNQDTRPDDADKIKISAVHPDNGLKIIVEDYKSGNEVFVIENLAFDDFEIEKTFRSSAGNSGDSFSRSSSSSYTQGDYTIAYHYRLDTDETNPGLLKELIEGLDIRDPVLDAQGTFTGKDGSEHKVSDYILQASTNPADAAQYASEFFSILDIFKVNEEREHLEYAGGGETGNVSILAYDIPRKDSDFVSLGALRNLPVMNESLATLGSTHPDAKNEIFDEYFVANSGVAMAGSAAPDTNPHLSYLEEVSMLSAKDVAANALLNGGFNINSTSVAAWMSFLSSRGVIEDATGDNITARHLFTRMPYYSAEHPDIVTNESVLRSTGASVTMPPVYEQGMRQLDPTDAHEKMLIIAEGIVDHLKQRGEPYASVDEFLDSGIIDELLEETEINKDILENSNVYITQGDIAAQRADLLTSRSDTFLIRSYGDARNAITGEVTAQAWAEGVVRRLPNLTNASGQVEDNALESNPREFEIVSWRWLDKSEVY
ncbi:hypothetical protein [Cerasicoccus maritimus]|uniref:hypothetical protein n=1 Tax=Cerasicoccus maritimus TaxID=490089 RepID=UPI002852CF18|nr:hypothetical protein [Cerasicoccus maritimus]